MADESCDFLVIGAGSGGIRAARVAAGLGAKVVIVEQGPLGGTCVNAGCVPKKLFFHAAEFAGTGRLAAAFGWTLAPEAFQWSVLVENKNKEINRLHGIYEELLKQSGVQILHGQACLHSPDTVRIATRRVRARHILIATGARPVAADFPGARHLLYSDALFHLPRLPASMAIIGGGYIALEFACIFNALGVKIDLIHRGGLFLRGFDHDLRQALADSLRLRGIALHFNNRVQAASPCPGGLQLSLDQGDDLEVEAALCAIGRRPNTGGLGLEALGVRLDARGAVVTDSHYCSSRKGIYAIGDVTNRVNLTPVAIAEGAALARRLFSPSAAAREQEVDYSTIPHCVFSQPPLATVGLDEQSARQHYPNVRSFQSRFRPLRQVLDPEGEYSLIKLVVDGDSDRVLGAQMLGEQAPEIIQGLAVAMRPGLSKAALDAGIGIHPSSAEEFIGLRE